MATFARHLWLCRWYEHNYSSTHHRQDASYWFTTFGCNQFGQNFHNNDSWLQRHMIHIHLYKSLRDFSLVWYLKIDKNSMMAVMHIFLFIYLLCLLFQNAKKNYCSYQISSVPLVLWYLLTTTGVSVVHPSCSDKICNLWPDEITRPTNSLLVLATK